MAITELNTIKNWFKTGLIPTQAQFWDTWDSFRHKNEKTSVIDIDGIDELLQNKAEREELEDHLINSEAHLESFNKKLDKGGYTGTAKDLYDLVKDNGSTGYKETIIDDDGLFIEDSESTSSKKIISFLNFKLILKSMFDSIYQSKLVSTINIKTLNGFSLLGSGNLSIGNSLKSFSIFDDNFEDGTASLTLSAGWSAGSDGIAISSSGGWGNSALLNKYTTIDRVSTRALVQIINTTSVFSIIRKPTTLNQFGTVAQVDCLTSSLKFYASWDGSTTVPDVAKSISIPFSIVANRKYLLELKKIKAITTVTFTDTTNLNNTISLTYDQENEAISGVGRQWGAPGVMFHSGSIKLKRFTYATEFPNAPKVLVTGHSFVEGYALYAEGDSSKTYSNLLFDSLNGDVAIAGRGGEDISTINTRNDIDFFSPTYHLVDIGSNDTVYATWLAGIQSYITKIIASGAIPVLATIVPRSDRQTFINQANDWIRLSGYNYVDFAKAVTLNNDSITQDPTLFWTDLVHPNIAGNAKMFQQLKIDAPYLWDGYVKPQTAVVNLDIAEVSKTASFTVSLTDSGKLYVINSSSAVVVTFPTGMTAGKWWEFISIGTGSVSFVAGSSATLISPDNRLKLRAQYSQARIVARASNQGALGGDIIL